ncbi:LLM class flavin-dependent oxidoreductase [Candidatus Bathyarchaeota archaeon]|nr:LLM class flavin-dependent oxidoreductase [Candidatus Bathyarchaeota archaeon]
MKIDYGVQIEPQFGYTYQMIKEAALAAEKHGFESLWASDHFMIKPEAQDVNCLEAWMVLAAVAQDTKKLRVGAMVASQSYRNPVLHAKMAASLDNISNGRVYFGIGAGWKEVEYNAYNIPFPPAWKRVKKLDEALTITRKIWTEPVADFKGKYYSVNDCVSMPKPVQDPLPICVGGMGDQLMKITAKHGDMLNLAWNTEYDKFKERLEVLKKYCQRYGRDYDSIRKSSGIHLALKGAEASSPAPYEKYSGEKKWDYRSPEDAAEWLRGYVELGVDHIVIVFPYGTEAKSIEVLMRDVAPLV